MTEDRSVLLFSYGTLQLPEVQMAQFGRLLEGSDDALPGYAQTLVEITDPDVIAKSSQRFHPIVTETGNLPTQSPARCSPSPRPNWPRRMNMKSTTTGACWCASNRVATPGSM